MNRVESDNADRLLHTNQAQSCLKDLQETYLPLLQFSNGKQQEFHPLVREFLKDKLSDITLIVALLPLAPEIGVNPWVLAMIILVASEVWFFPFQVDWHTLANSTTDGKGFTYHLIARISPVYAIAYILALIAAIPYWRYLGLIR